MFKVGAKYLLPIAAVVWTLAGLNIFFIGIQAAFFDAIPWLTIIGILVIFLAFYLMFRNIVNRHVDRIREYGENKVLFLKFFDARGYIVMAIMMGGGIALRAFEIVPAWFVAFFYTGLGAALVLAGISFIVHYKRSIKLATLIIQESE